MSKRRGRSEADQRFYDQQHVLEFMRRRRGTSLTTAGIAQSVGLPHRRALMACLALKVQAGLYKKDDGWCAC